MEKIKTLVVSIQLVARDGQQTGIQNTGKTYTHRDKFKSIFLIVRNSQHTMFDWLRALTMSCVLPSSDPSNALVELLRNWFVLSVFQKPHVHVEICYKWCNQHLLRSTEQRETAGSPSSRVCVTVIWPNWGPLNVNWLEILHQLLCTHMSMST